MQSSSSVNYYLLKAEPDSRVVKGKDVKFSVDDFEQVKTSPWEGVRNFEARNIMKEMSIGDKALFYHSNCKVPGIAAFAEVSKEAYPDFTAWDPNHPYYDLKTDQANPKWYMVDLTFAARAKHFVPLALLRYISTISLSTSTSEDSVPNLISEIAYLGRDGVSAIKGMGLVTRGRLSVQRVRQEEWDAINLLAEKGGWEDLDLKKLGVPTAGNSGAKAKSKSAPRGQGKKKVRAIEEEDGVDDDEPVHSAPKMEVKEVKKPDKRKSAFKLADSQDTEVEPSIDPQTRRSSRLVASQTSGDLALPTKATKRRKVG